MSLFDSILYFNPQITAADLQCIKQAVKFAKKLDIDIDDDFGLGRIQVEIFESTPILSLVPESCK